MTSPSDRPEDGLHGASPPSEGADAFEIEVPVGPTPDDLTPEIVDEPVLGALHVLLVEDNDDHAALVEALLEDSQAPIVTLTRAETVEAAEAELRSAAALGERFDVVLCDQQLPDSAYWETVARVVAAATGVPVVALTSIGDADVALDAVRRGATDYLVKSELTPELLRRTLRHAVERAQRAAALRDTNDVLRHTLRHVRQMQAQLVEQEKLAGLGRLLAGIAHELRNPLGLAVNFAEVAASEAEALRAALDGAEVSDEAREALAGVIDASARVAWNGRRADVVVAAMYQHAQGVDGELRPVALDAIVRAALAQIDGPGAQRAEIEAAVNGGEVRGVGSALARMLANVLDNAVYAARRSARRRDDGSRGRVRVSAHDGADATGAPAVVLLVEDDGEGLVGEANRVFEPFYSAWGSARRVGLGLSLARAVAVGHGGTIELAPSGLGGLAVRIVLPREAQA